MYNKAKKQMSKILAGLLALIMVLGVIPGGLYVTAFAASVERYSVKVTDQDEQPLTEAVTVTLTDKSNGEKTKSVQVENGVAVFENFVEENAAYAVSVFGYTSDPSELTVAEGDIETTLKLTALNKVTLTGKVLDENGNAYEGAAVKLTGYQQNETTTNAEGSYSFEVYQGQNYTVTATAKEAEKYDSATAKIAAFSGGEVSDLQFALKEFALTITAEGKGTVTPGSSINVKYGASQTITAKADENYYIDSFTVDGLEQIAEGEKPEEFTRKIENITADHSVKVKFAIKTFEIAFTIGENGQVTYSDDSQPEVPAGKVTTEKVQFNAGTKVTVTATPADNFRVSSVTIDNKTPETFDENNQAYKHTFTMNGSHTFVVEFAPNAYEVTLEPVDTAQGKVNITPSGKIQHGESIEIQVTPTAGYDLDEIKVNDTAVDFGETDAETYTATVNITADTTVKVTFVQKSAISGDGYEIIWPAGKYSTVDGVTYVQEGATVEVKPKDPYTRVRINDAWALTSNSGNSLLVKLGTEDGSVEEITGIRLSSRVGSWTPSQELNIKAYNGTAAINVDDGFEDWKNGTKSVEYSFAAADPIVGIKEVRYGTEQGFNKATVLEAKDGKYSFSVGPVDEDRQIDYYLYAQNGVGKITESKVKVKLDVKKPESVTFQFITKENTIVEDAINKLSFGMFCKERVYVTVAASDSGSGVKAITLYADGKSIATKDADEDGTAKFAIPEEAVELKDGEIYFDSILSATATDNVGNTCDPVMPYALVEGETDEKNRLMIETVKPVISAISDEAADKRDSSKNGNIYSSDIKFSVEVQDAQSGLAYVNIWVNGDLIDVDGAKVESGIEHTVTYTTREKEKQTFEFTTKKLSPNKDGEYIVKVTAVDNAGNVSDGKTLTVHKDTTAPVITEFKFYNSDKGEITSEILNGQGQNDYGYYYNADTTIRVYAEDKRSEYEVNSGVATITVILRDSNGKLYVVSDDGMLQEVTDASIKGSAMTPNKEAYVEFVLKESFKGQIFAFATDKVGNNRPAGQKFPVINGTSITVDNVVTSTDNVLCGYQYPNGTILEDLGKHNDTSSIIIDPPETELETIDGKILYARREVLVEGVPVEGVPVKVTVTDTYSGIASIEWSVKAPEDSDKNQHGMVKVANDGTLSHLKPAKDEDGKVQWETDPEHQVKWSKPENDTDNLVYEMTGTITVTNNSNDIVVWVKLTDRAGNTSEESLSLNIDKTRPKINVTYDNNSPDEENRSYYNADRTAEIKITERNFDPEKVLVTITKDGKPYDSGKLTWTDSNTGEHRTDNDTHSAKIVFSDDGDYTLSVSCKDLVGLDDVYGADAFTIDKTWPTVSVSYDNMSALNGNYYKADRIATITIVEHNFDAGRVNVIGSAADNGAAVTFPTLSGWSNSGDTHTATLRYSADAKYSFDIEFTDMAGNSIADYTPEEFYVDKTAPTLEISGVADKSANNGTIAPVIAFTDTNYDENAVSYTLTGVNNGKVTYSSTIANITNGQRVTFADFERIQKVDDIYILTATLTDLAGNETSQSITFSANRFGSVYDLSALEALIGKYLQQEEDIVFTEINVDSLKKGETKLKLTKNGTPQDLVEGQDYTIVATGGNGQWCQYQYTLNKSLFADDGRYSISVYSVDAAGNINENIDEAKKAEISFGIDKTLPVIVPIDFEDGKQYPVEVKTVSAEIKDNLVLEGVKIYLNGSEIQYNSEGETYTFEIPEKNEKQNVRIVAVDAAGNEYELLVRNFLVSTNVFVRWFNNTPLFVGSIAGVVVLCGLILFLVLRKRKQESK